MHARHPMRRSMWVACALFAATGACNEPSSGSSDVTLCSGADCPNECVEGASECHGDRSAACREGVWVEQACPVACKDGRCVECSEVDRRCVGSVAETCVEGRFVSDECGAFGCRDGRCQCPQIPYRCTEGRREHCGEDGRWSADPCPSAATLCEGGECLRCTPGSAVCHSERASRICSDNGKSEGVVACANGCDPATGICIEPCAAGSQRCRGVRVVEQCSDDGSRYVEAGRCEESDGAECVEGECRRSCDEAARTMAPSGCRFRGSPTPFIDGRFQFYPESHAVGPPTKFHVLNPNVSSPAVVRAFQSGALLAEFSIAPSSYQTLHVPGVSVSAVESTHLRDAVVTLESNRAVFVVSHLDLREWPQANSESSLAGDTAFLLPDHLLQEHGTRYRALSRPTCITPHSLGAGTYIRPGGFSVMALSDETTRIRMTLKAPMAPGPQNDPPLYPSGVSELDLVPGDVFHFRTHTGCGAGFLSCSSGDPTGSLIESADGRPIAVFAGGVSRVACTAGHIQNQLLEQLMPVPLWGGGAGDAHLAIVRQIGNADEEWVAVTDEPSNLLQFHAASGDQSHTLSSPGDHFRFTSAAGAFTAFRLESSKPLLLGRFRYFTAPNGVSTFALERPVRFWRSDYQVASVGGAINRLLMVVPGDARVSLDGIEIPGSGSQGPPGHRVYDVEVGAGAHRLSSADPFGLLIYGLDAGSVTGNQSAYSYSGPVGFGDAL